MQNCRDYTTGESCELCLEGYEGDPTNGVPCRPASNYCDCDYRGASSTTCNQGYCQCKMNAEGPRCDRCKPGTFGLNETNPKGCLDCFCSGVATECSESNFFIEQIPVQIFDADTAGFSLTDRYERERVTSGFHASISTNEIGYTFRPSSTPQWYWSLPRDFTGNRIKSYGGRLELTQRYTQRPQASYVPDQDIIITGNGVTIYWTNPEPQLPDRANVSRCFQNQSNCKRLFFFAESFSGAKSGVQLATFGLQTRPTASFQGRHFDCFGER